MIIGNNIYSICLRFKYKIIILLFFVLFQSILNVLTIISIAPIVDFLLINELDKINHITLFFKKIFSFFNINFNIKHAFILFGTLIFLVALSNLALIYLNLRVKYSILTNVKTDTMKLFLKSNYLFFSNKKIGKLINTFELETNKLVNAIEQSIVLLSSLIQAIIILIIPFTISVKFSILFLIILLIFILPGFFVKNIAYQYGLKNTQTANDLSNNIYSILTSIKLIFSYGMNNFAQKNFKESLISHVNTAIKSQFITQATYVIFFSLAMISILIPSYFYLKSDYALSNLVIIILSFQRMFPYLASVLRSRAIIINSKSAFEQINVLQNEAYKLSNKKNGFKKFLNFENHINLDSIYFHYPSNKNILENFNLSIKKNKITTIYGKSGSGKTTVIDILTGLLVPQKGYVWVDNKKLSDFDINSFRAKIGYIPQDPILFNLTINENLLWANPDAKEKEVWEALKFVEMDKFINNLPLKLNTIVGDRGHSLSGGQRQRIAFARALIRNPEILILDEATSSIDLETRKIIEKKILDLSGKLTIVIISHSSNFNEKSDNICEMKN